MNFKKNFILILSILFSPIAYSSNNNSHTNSSKFKQIKPIHSLIKIASNVNIITDFHLKEDRKDTEIGTTKRGNGPAYRDKYARKGVHALEIPELEDYIIDKFKSSTIGTINFEDLGFYSIELKINTSSQNPLQWQWLWLEEITD